MSTRKFTILLSLLIMISGNLFSQKVFWEGYIVKNSGETLTGLIGLNSTRKMPSNFLFKKFDIAMEVPYNSSQVKAFGILNGKRYEALNIDGKVTFYETIVQGELSVYFNGSKYFLRKGDLHPVEVRDGQILWNDGETDKEFSNLADLLRFLTTGTKIDIHDNLLLKNDLIQVVTAYNKEIGEAYFVSNRNFSEKELALQAWKSGANRNRFGIVTGINSYLLKVQTSDGSTYLPVPDRKTGLIFGVSYEKLISRQSDNLTLRVEALYQKVNFYTHSEREVLHGRLSMDETIMDFSGIKIPLLIQYSFTGNRITPFVNGGLSKMLILSKKYSHISEVNYNDDIRIYEDNNLVFSSGELSAIVGAGMNLRIINQICLNIEGRIEFGAGVFSQLKSEMESFKQSSLQSSILISVSF